MSTAPVIDPAAPPAPDPAPTPPPPGDPPKAPPAVPAAAAPPKDPAPPSPETPDEKIARLEDEVKKVRDEAAKARIGKKSAVEEAQADLAKKVGAALGLVPEDTSDPAKLLEQSNAFKAQARQAEVQLAVYQAAESANADPQALLDSRTFLARVAEIDPNDAPALAAAITEAVTANPRLGKPAPTGMRPNPAQGASASPPLGLDAQIRAAELAGDMNLSMRLKSARLNELSKT